MRVRQKSRLLGILAVAGLVTVAVVLAVIDPDVAGDPCEGQEVMTEITREYVRGVRAKYAEQILQYPNVHGLGTHTFKDREGNPTGRLGVEIRVTKKVPNSEVPEHLRIPDCLDGVPVVWVEQELHKFQDDD